MSKFYAAVENTRYNFNIAKIYAKYKFSATTAVVKTHLFELRLALKYKFQEQTVASSIMDGIAALNVLKDNTSPYFHFLKEMAFEEIRHQLKIDELKQADSLIKPTIPDDKVDL